MNMYQSIIRIGLPAGIWLLCCLGIPAAEVVVPVQQQQSSSLQTLEQKANESDHYRSQYMSMRQLIEDMLGLLPAGGENQGESTGTDDPGKELRQSFGQLSDLLEKASKADSLAQEVSELWKEIDAMHQQISHMEEELQETRAERDQIVKQLEEFKAQAEKWDGVTAGLRETIQRLLLGEYEYYEVKDGDTLQSIAANPMVYGDVSRAAWLRQVNEGLVKHIDNLRAGEVLVIPRFPRNGSYEF